MVYVPWAQMCSWTFAVRCARNVQLKRVVNVAQAPQRVPLNTRGREPPTTDKVVRDGVKTCTTHPSSTGSRSPVGANRDGGQLDRGPTTPPPPPFTPSPSTPRFSLFTAHRTRERGGTIIVGGASAGHLTLVAPLLTLGGDPCSCRQHPWYRSHRVPPPYGMRVRMWARRLPLPPLPLAPL
jgi:hypothetical protein